MNPRGKARAGDASVHFSGTGRNRCLLKRTVSVCSPLPTNSPHPVLPVTEHGRKESWSECVYLFVCVSQNAQKDSLSLSHLYDILEVYCMRVCMHAGVCVCFVSEETRKESVFFLHIWKEDSQCEATYKYGFDHFPLLSQFQCLRDRWDESKVAAPPTELIWSLP